MPGFSYVYDEWLWVLYYWKSNLLIYYVFYFNETKSTSFIVYRHDFITQPPPSAYYSMGASTFGSTVDNYWSQAMNGNSWAEQAMYKNGLAIQARGGDMGAVREYAARYGGGG